MRGTFVSVAKRTCAAVLMGYLFWSTLRPVFSKAIGTVVCIDFCTPSAQNICFAFFAL